MFGGEIFANFRGFAIFFKKFAKISPTKNTFSLPPFAKIRNWAIREIKSSGKKSLLHCLISHPILKEQASFR